MSLINQVLNDLEKRGVAKSAMGDEAIRIVPSHEKSKMWLYFAAVILAASIVALLWVIEHKQTTQPQIAAVTSVPIVGVMTISHAAVESQPQPASTVGQTITNAESTDDTKPIVVVKKPKIEVAATPLLVKKSNSNDGIAQITPEAKKFKKISLQQQAENEFRKAYLLAQQGRYADAVTGYQIALKLDPSHVMAREALVSALQESKRYVEAESVLNEALSLDVKQTHFAMILARLQVERNAVPLALETLEKSLPYAEKLADYQAFIAAILQRQARHKEAITFYQNALLITPTSGLWLMGIGISMQADKQKDEALDAYKRALETHSLTPELQAFVEQRIKEIKPK